MTHHANRSRAEDKKNASFIMMSKKTLLTWVIIVAAIAVLYLCRGLVLAASVNGHPVSRRAVINELEKKSGKATLESLINKKLIDEEAKKQGITVTDEEADAQMKAIEAQFAGGGVSFDDLLTQQGLTREELKEQLHTQLKIEKLLAEKIVVTDEEVAAYIKENKITLPKGTETAAKDQIKEDIRQQKMATEVDAWVTELRTNAKVRYFVTY